MGVETFIADMGDCLPDLFAALDPAFKVHRVERQAFLFRMCVHSGGWQHMWDLILQVGLCSLNCFPSWLAKLTSLTGLPRNRNDVVVWVKRLRPKHPTLAATLEKFSISSFAKWRWYTLYVIFLAIFDISPTLCAHWNRSMYRNFRDTGKTEDAHTAMTDPSWKGQLKYVYWFCSWICPIGKWRIGCECCDGRLLMGEEVSCSMKRPSH